VAKHTHTPPPLVCCCLRPLAICRLLSVYTSASSSLLPAPLYWLRLCLLLPCCQFSAGASASYCAVASCCASASHPTPLIWLVVAPPPVRWQLRLLSSFSCSTGCDVASHPPAPLPLIEPLPPVMAPPPISQHLHNLLLTCHLSRASASCCAPLIWLIVASL